MVSNQVHFVGVTGASSRRFSIMGFFNRLVKMDESERPILHSIFPYARLTIDSLQTIHLFGSYNLRGIDFFRSNLPNIKYLVLIDSRTPELFREVKSIVQSLQILKLLFVIIGHSVNHPDSWQKEEIRRALKIEPYVSLEMTSLETPEDMRRSVGYCIDL